jgi:hypothetical protein
VQRALVDPFAKPTRLADSSDREVVSIFVEVEVAVPHLRPAVR